MEKIKVLGVQAGNGMCLWPFEKSRNFEVVGNIETRPVFYDKGQKQWNANFREALQSRTLSDQAKLKDIDVIIGHPDCGGSSILRMSRAKKYESAKENQSVTTYLHAIQLYKPKIFLLENLPGFLEAFDKTSLKILFPEYRIKIHISSVAAWGNSQVSRVRLVIIGIRRDIHMHQKGLFNIPHYENEVMNSEHFEESVTEDIDLGHVREPSDKMANLYWEGERKISYKMAQDIWMIPYRNKTKWEVGGKMKNQPGVSRNVVGKPPFTVRKQNRQFSNLGLVLSPREMANIQGVPKDFKLHIEEDNLIYWLNKARTTVTKSMPYDIAEWFMIRCRRALKRD